MLDGTATTPGRLRVGCAMWALPAWREHYRVPAGGELEWFSARFDTVEGNTTFYAVPSAATVARWIEESRADFRFCFKVPRRVTHERRLRDADEDLLEFLDRMAPLEARLGPMQVQLPASFGPDDLPVLLDFLDRAPGLATGWAVEVRHRDFCAGGSHERRLNDALAQRGVDRVILDSRALFAAEPTTREELDAWNNKPRLPVRPVATGAAPLIRLIGQRDPEESLIIWRRWFPKLVEWTRAGASPSVFVHTPDNARAPELARHVEAELAELLGPSSARAPKPALEVVEQPGLFTIDE